MNKTEFINKWKWQKITGGGSASFDFGSELEKDLDELLKANRFDALVRVRVVESFLTDSPYLKDLKLSCGHTKLSHPIRGNKIPKTVVCWDCSGTPA